MLNVYICEDNETQLMNIKAFIEETITIEALDFQIVLVTKNPYELLENVSLTSSTGIYFLDVDFGVDINGIELAEKIRQHDPRGFIVFITTHAELSYLTFQYKVEALDYIIKDSYENIRNRAHQCLMNANEKYYRKVNDVQKSFYLEINDRIINVDFNKIIFFETSSKIHKITLYAEDRQIEFYGNMKDIEDKLDERFCRCHRSFLVNKDKIKEIDKKARIVYMVNGQTCDVSVRGLKVFN